MLNFSGNGLKKIPREPCFSRELRRAKFSSKWLENVEKWQALILYPIPRLGGPGVIIQIDESKFNHKSNVSKKDLNNLVSSQYCHCRVLI